MTAEEVRSAYHPRPTRVVLCPDGTRTYWVWSWKGRWIEVVPFAACLGAQLAKNGRVAT